MTPNKNTPLNAPSVVAVSNVMASRMFVRRPRRYGAALPHEQAITETMLAHRHVNVDMAENRQDGHDENPARHAKHPAQRAGTQ